MCFAESANDRCLSCMSGPLCMSCETSTCSSCEECTGCSNCLQYCALEDCSNEKMCRQCLKSCSNCKQNVCKSCIVVCRSCDTCVCSECDTFEDGLCFSCMVECSSCGKRVDEKQCKLHVCSNSLTGRAMCAACFKKNVCSTCNVSTCFKCKSKHIHHVECSKCKKHSSAAKGVRKCVWHCTDISLCRECRAANARCSACGNANYQCLSCAEHPHLCLECACKACETCGLVSLLRPNDNCTACLRESTVTLAELLPGDLVQNVLMFLDFRVFWDRVPRPFVDHSRQELNLAPLWTSKSHVAYVHHLSRKSGSKKRRRHSHSRGLAVERCVRTRMNFDPFSFHEIEMVT